MKKTVYPLYLIALSLFFVSCEKESAELEISIPPMASPSETGSISFGGYIITLSSEASNATFRISTNKRWNIAMPDTWCQNELDDSRRSTSYYAVGPDFWSTFSTYSGNGSREVIISVAENQSYHSRYYSFLVKAGDLSKEILVKQLGKPYLEIEHPYYEIAANVYPTEFQIFIYVYSSVGIKVESNAEWIRPDSYSAAVVGEKMIYRAELLTEKNLSPTPREAILTFTQGSLSKTVTVRQAGAE